MLRYSQLARNEREFLSMTGLTVQEFDELVPAFQASFERHLAEWTMDGTPRVGRVYRQYKNCPLPATEDKLLFVLVFLRKATDQTLHGQVFGLSQSNTNTWLHLLLAVLDQTVAQLGERPARSAAELARRLRVEPAVAEPSAAADQGADPRAARAAKRVFSRRHRPPDPTPQRRVGSERLL
ncbi:MAG: hypothetical protein AMXMBFR16_11880 [Candidatus Uhrbacteria bacterium]